MSQLHRIIFTVIFIIISSHSMAANNVPASVVDAANRQDAGRFGLDRENVAPPIPKPSSLIKQEQSEVNIPDETKDIKFVLKRIKIEGLEKFSSEEIRPLYQEHINQPTNLYTIWQIAAKITKYYQDRGYFISQASVPSQEISSRGIVTIRIAEGYVGELIFDEALKKNSIVVKLIDKIKSEKPLNINTLESAMLRLNDLPNMSFQSVIEPLKDGAVRLTLISKKKQNSGQISFDNYNSKYIGPYEATVSYQASLSEASKTSISYITSTPRDKLENFSLNHDITISSGLVLGLSGSKTTAQLGDDLKVFEIESNSDNAGISLTKQLVRQRQKNLSVKLELERKNIKSDILGDPLSRDHIREATISLMYDGSDSFAGYNYFNIELTHGISGLGASKKGDDFLSHQKVNPNYKKLELNFNRFQNINRSFLAVISGAAQVSSGRLYASSRFGYGGQAFGRGYDSSTITGDEGINGGVEMRYMSIPRLSFFGHQIRPIPYVYYDVGKMWSEDEKPAILSSVGEGVRIESSTGFSASFVAANPIKNKGAASDYYNHKDTRYLFQVAYKF